MCSKTRYRVILLICTLLLLLPGFAAAKWDLEVREIIAVNRTRFTSPLTEGEVIGKVQEMLYIYDSFSHAPTLIPLHEQQGYAKSFITKEEAILDTEFLFQLLKYGYAGYQFRGGDASFLAAKETILTTLEQDFPKRFKTGDFQNLLFDKLSFIDDGHFYIGSQRFLEEIKAYLNFEYYFLKDAKGFYLANQEPRAYLKEIAGKDVEKYLLPSLNETGEVVYRVGVLRPAGRPPIQVDLRLMADNLEKELTLTLTQIAKSSMQMDYNIIYERYSVADIPVIAVNRFPTQGGEIEAFARDAKELKNEDSLIIDLRHNYGGFTEHVINRLMNFTDGTIDSFVSPGLTKVTLLTPTSIQLAADYWERLGDSRMVEYIKAASFSKTGWSDVGYLPPRRVANPVKVVVLTDSTASAGEFFINFLMNLENVVILGTNTEGLLQFGFPYYHPLPNSQLNVTMGADFMPQPDLVDREGIGYLPDFWVNPEDALDLAIKFIKNYGWDY